nr:sulfite exporter TauE/SafE family protein [Atopomonas sediminilitoris]
MGAGIGTLLGLLLGLTGAGGSLIALPLLLSLHLPLVDAVGVSLGAVSLAALSGVATRRHDIAWWPVLTIAASGIPGTALGQWLGRLLPEQPLIIAFCVLVLWLAQKLWRSAAGAMHTTRTSTHYPGLLISGIGVGSLSGLLGVGGGFLVVPLLRWLTPLNVMAAAATSLAIIVLVAGSGFALYASQHSAPWPLLASLIGGGIVGAMAGSALAKVIGGTQVQRVFAVLLVGVSLSTAAYKLTGG